jgi:hypothetical protein
MTPLSDQHRRPLRAGRQLRVQQHLFTVMFGPAAFSGAVMKHFVLHLVAAAVLALPTFVFAETTNFT